MARSPRAMTERFYVRRGQRVKGPVARDRVIAACKAGSLLPSDEIAGSPSGPWRRVDEAFRRPGADIPVVESFTLKKSLLGGAHVAAYSCVHCDAPLQSDESDWNGIETCPTCGKRYRLSPRAAAEVAAERRRQQQRQEAAAAAAERARAEREAARREAADRRAEDRRIAEQRQREADAGRQAAELRVVQAAAATRRRPGACWYCGAAIAPATPQCGFCHMLPLTHAPRLAGAHSRKGDRDRWNTGS